MTLDTRVYVLDEVGLKDVFLECNRLIGATEATQFSNKPSWNNKDESLGGEWLMSNDPNQGLCAWLMVFHRRELPLRSAEQAAAHDEDICNLPGVSWYDAESGPCDGAWHRPACWLEVSFDTAYSYRDEHGRSCGDLHASFIAELGKWLAGRGVRWLWQNEYTGEVHSGYERLDDLCSTGAQASAWFRTTVLPAIAGGTLGRSEDL